MVDVASTLELLRPAPKFFGSLTDNTQASYDAIEWNDDRPKPTFDEILAAAPVVDKQELKFFASKTRFESKMAGFIFKSNLYATDPQAERAYTMNAVAARDTPLYTVKWKLPNETFVVLNQEDVIALVVAITNFTNALYAAEAECIAGIDNGTIMVEQEITDIFAAVPNSDGSVLPETT